MRGVIAASLLLYLVAVAIFIAGCGSDASPDTPAATEEVPAGGPAIPLDEPPGTTASAGGRSVEMGIGTYCWTRMCVDKIGPVTKATLSLARGDRVTVAVPSGTPNLREVSVTAFPAGASSDLGNGETAWQPRFEAGSELTPSVSGNSVRFTANLSPGKYVLVAGMFFEAGDVQYAVVLEVR
jgi:hypothetical protein